MEAQRLGVNSALIKTLPANILILKIKNRFGTHIKKKINDT